MNHISHLLLYLMIIFHTKNLIVRSQHEQSNICTTDICAAESARMLHALSDRIDPCDDFYEFACGKLIRNTRLPETKDSQTVFSEVQKIVDAQIQSILIADAASNETTATKLAKMFTRVCFDDGRQLQHENGDYLIASSKYFSQ